MYFPSAPIADTCIEAKIIIMAPLDYLDRVKRI